MATPDPIFVSPSTTFVQVDQLQSPNVSIFLESIQYTGQTVSLTTTVSSAQILQNPILISTTSNQSFQDGLTSTFIDQPEGFLTFQAILPSTYTVLNSFPFRNQQDSLYNLTASNLYTAGISSIEANTSFLQVENLIVQGTFFQSSGLILNTNLSSLGTVDFESSISIYGNVFFSSQMNVSGAVSLFSSLEIGKNLTVSSPLQFFSTVNVSGSLFLVSSISTSKINLQDGLIAKTIEVQQSTLDAMNIGGSYSIRENLVAFSTVYTGSSFTSKTLYTGENLEVAKNGSHFGNVVLGDSFYVSGFTSTVGSYRIADIVSIGGNLETQSSLYVRDRLDIANDISVQGILSTFILQAKEIQIGKGLREMNPFENHIDTLYVGGSGQSFDLNSRSTYVGGTVSTGTDYINLKQINISSSLFIAREQYIYDSLTTSSNIHVLQSTVVGKDVYSFSNMNGLSMDVMSTLFLNGGTVQSNVKIYGDLDVRGFLFISSIVLTSSIVAQNFTVSTLFVEYKGVSPSSLISSVYTSSITNYTPTTNEIFNIEGILYAASLSTSLLSSQELYLSTTIPSSFFKVSNALGVGLPPQANEVNIRNTTYATNDIYALENISTGEVIGTNITGNFFGDGRLLSNVAFPTNFTVSTIEVSSIAAGTIFTNILYASTGIINETLLPYSTLRVGNLNIFGNAANVPLFLSTPFLATSANNSNILTLQNMNIYRNESPFGNCNAVYINKGYTNSEVQAIQNSNVKLFIDGIFRFDDIVSPSFSLLLTSLNTGTLRVSTIFPFENATQLNSTNYATLFLSSGTLGLQSNGTFLIPEAQRVASISTNIIQTLQSTLIFNSTLYVRQDTAQVGINTMPNFELDVPRQMIVRSTIQTQETALVHGQVQQELYNTNLWYLQAEFFFGGPLLYSRNPSEGNDFGNYWTGLQSPLGGTDFEDIQYGGPTGNQWLFASRTNGLYTRYGNDPRYPWVPLENAFVNSNSFKKMSWNGNVWVAWTVLEGNNSIVYSYDSFNWNQATVNIQPTKFFGDIGRFAWNGHMWLASCLFAGVLYSYNSREWFSKDPGGYGTFPSIYSVVWADNRWIAVGNAEAYTPGANNFSYSQDGINWTTSNVKLQVSSIRLGNLPTLPVRSGTFGLYDLDYDGSLLCGVGTFNTRPPDLGYDAAVPAVFYSEDYGVSWNFATLSGIAPYGYDVFTTYKAIPIMNQIIYGGGQWLSSARRLSGWGYFPDFNGSMTSSNGKNWNLTFYCYFCDPLRVSRAPAYSSNAFPSLRAKSQSTMISFYENPQNRLANSAPSSPMIVYTSTFLKISNSLFIDSYRNIGMGFLKSQPNSYSTGSTFFQYGDGNISTLLSTQLLYASEYRLGIQNI
jgi:hypothetical protein